MNNDELNDIFRVFYKILEDWKQEFLSLTEIKKLLLDTNVKEIIIRK